MISKLPPWVWVCAWLLSFVAGIVNVVGLLGFTHEAITHLTGSTSLLAASIAVADASSIVHFICLIGAFVFGCAICGFVVRDGALQLGLSYGFALLSESVLLIVASVFLSRSNPAGFYFAACACGMQNAMISTYTGTVVRTTHVSGMFTDLGIFAGHFLRGIPVDPRRLWLYMTVISGFLCGGTMGTFCFQVVDYFTLLIPAALTASAAVIYFLFWCKRAAQ
jgi:uncharacterized membrane protein YoaK (UPF0700 family)